MSVIINTNSRLRFSNRINNSLNINENSRAISNNTMSLNIDSNSLVLNTNIRDLQQANSNFNESIDNTLNFTINTNNVDKEIRFVDLVISDYVLLSEKENFNLPENIIDYSGINTPSNIIDFYKNENLKINKNVCLLHGIKSAYNNIISDEISEFSNVKIEIVKSLEGKLKSQIINFSKKNSLFDFIDKSIKENQIFFQDTQSSLKNSLNKINQLVKTNNYVHIVQDSFKDDQSLSSNYFGKIFNTVIVEKENPVLINRSTINSDQIDAETFSVSFLDSSDTPTQDIISKKLGIDFKQSDSPFMSFRHNYNNNSFISQLLVNGSFSFYGIYPTLLQDNILYLQNLKDKYPSVIINYYNPAFIDPLLNPLETILSNPFLDISTNSKSFNNLKYYEKNFSYYPAEIGINLNNIDYINDADIASDLRENQAINFQKFVSFFYSENSNPQRSLADILRNGGQRVSELSQTESNLITSHQYLSRLSILIPYNSTISSDFTEPEFYSLDKISYSGAKCSLFYNILTTETGRIIYNTSIANEDGQSNILKRIVEDINNNKISDVSKFIDYISQEAYEFLLNSMFYTSNNDIYFDKINESRYGDGISSYRPIESLEQFITSDFKFRVTNRSYISNFSLSRISCDIKNIKRLKEFLNFYKSINNNDKIEFLNKSVRIIEDQIEGGSGEPDLFQTYDWYNGDRNEILDLLQDDNSFVNEALFEGVPFRDKKVELLDKLVFDYLNEYYYSLFYLSFNFNNLRTNIFYTILQTIIRFYNNSTNIDEIYNLINVNNDFSLSQFEEIIEFFATNEEELIDQSENIFKQDLINADSTLNNQEFISNTRLNNFIDIIQITKDINRNRGYLYYTTNINDTFKNLTNQQSIRLNESEDLYKDSNYSSYKISFYVDDLIKKTKLYSLEKNNINYNAFKNIANKLSEFSEDIFEIPVFCSDEDKKLGLLDESQSAFNYLLSKSGDFYYSNLDFTNDFDLKELKIKNTLNRISNDTELGLDVNKELKNMLNMFSNYYYDNSINMSNHLIKKIIKEIKTPKIETSINDDALTFLYFTNFETNKSNTNFDAKDAITKRFLKKAISFRNNANSNLKNSNLGYEFTTSTADFDALSSFNKEIVDADSDVSFYDYSTEIVEFFTNLFSTNEEYNIIRNAIFNNNDNIDLQYDFYYIPIESINTKTKSFNFHVCFNKFRDSHQDFIANMNTVDSSGGPIDFDINTDERSFGFLFDAYVYCFPNTILKKKNIPYKIPTRFINYEEIKNKSFNNQTIVKNYVKFDSNINDKKASAYITYNIKNERNEFATLARKKIVDEFDNLCKKEDTIFNNIIKKINVILEAVTNVKDLTFEDVSDLDDFIDNNKFILGLVGNLITIYSEIYNKNYRENQTKNFIENINDLNSNNVIEDYSFNNIDASETKKISAEFVNLQKHRAQNTLDLDNVNNNRLISYNEILRKNFVKLRESDYLQAITFDMILGFFRKIIEFEENKEENKDIVVNNDVLDLTSSLGITNQEFIDKINLFDLNSISKEISNNFYKAKNNYKNLIKDQQNNENIKEFYSDRIDRLYSNYLNSKIENLKSNNFSILKEKNLNRIKILTFGLKKSILKNINYDQAIKIKVKKYKSYNKNKPFVKEFLFSPILTGFDSFYNDNVNLDRNIGLYDIFKEDINERFVIVNRETAKEYLKKITNENSNGSILINKLINDHIESNILDKILNLFYDFKVDINDFSNDSNNRYSEIDLLNQINKLSAFDFTNIFKYNKTTFDNTITVSEDIVVLPDFIETLETKSLVYDFMCETSKIYSNIELQNVFKNKEFYDFYNVSMPISNELETIEIEYSIENISY